MFPHGFEKKIFSTFFDKNISSKEWILWLWIYNTQINLGDFDFRIFNNICHVFDLFEVQRTKTEIFEVHFWLNVFQFLLTKAQDRFRTLVALESWSSEQLWTAMNAEEPPYIATWYPMAQHQERHYQAVERSVLAKIIQIFIMQAKLEEEEDEVTLFLFQKVHNQ